MINTQMDLRYASRADDVDGIEVHPVEEEEGVATTTTFFYLDGRSPTELVFFCSLCTACPSADLDLPEST
jgi:hypothetical protein